MSHQKSEASHTLPRQFALARERGKSLPLFADLLLWLIVAVLGISGTFVAAGYLCDAITKHIITVTEFIDQQNILGYLHVLLLILCLLYVQVVQRRSSGSMGFHARFSIIRILEGCVLASAITLVMIFVTIYCTNGTLTFLRTISLPVTLVSLGAHFVQALALVTLVYGFLMTSIARRHSLRTAGFIAALAFAVLSAGYAMFAQFPGLYVLPVLLYINYFLLGLLLAYIFRRTQSIWMCAGFLTAWQFVTAVLVACLPYRGAPNAVWFQALPGDASLFEALLPAPLASIVSEGALLTGGAAPVLGNIITTAVLVICIVFEAIRCSVKYRVEAVPEPVNTDVTDEPVTTPQV